MENGNIRSHPLKENGMDEIRIPPNACAYVIKYDSIWWFYSEDEINGRRDIRRIPPGYYRRIIINSKIAVGYIERSEKLI